MDGLSIGASGLSLHQHRESIASNLNEDAFNDVIASCRSLSQYESRTIRSAYPQIISSVIAGSFHIVIGIALAYSAILIPQVELPDSDLHMTSAESSWVASIIVIAVPIGCIFSGFFMEVIGRINVIKLAVIPCAIGWATIALAQSTYVILLGRFLTGLGCALGTSPAIVYITEVARPDLRGSLISSAPTIASLGMVIAYASGAIMDWRLAAWLGIGFTLLPIILIQLFVYESPVWLVNKGRMEDAYASLKYLYKAYPPPIETNEPLAQIHLNALIQNKEAKLMEQRLRETQDNGKTESKWAGFLRPTGYKPLILLFFLFLIQQFSGIYITLFYAITFLQDMGTDVDAYTASIFVGITRFVMSLLNSYLLKRFKRRQLVMFSSVAMAICMFISGAFTIWIKEGTVKVKFVPVICLLLYVCASMIGLLTIPWTMTAELFPNEIRGLAHSVSYSMANILMFFAIQSYRPLLHLFGNSESLQWFFAVVSIAGFFFGLIFLPETHGKSLDDIERYFSGKKKVHKRTDPQPREKLIERKLSVFKGKLPSPLETVKEAEAMLQHKEDA